MKHFACLFFLTALLSTGLSAQVSVGLNVSYNHSWQDYMENLLILRYRTYVNKPGVSATVQYDIDRHISLIVEPGFVQRGTDSEPVLGLPFIPFESSFVASYLEMPVLLQGRLFAFKGMVQFFLQAGAGYSYMLSAYRDTRFPDLLIPEERSKVNFGNETNISRLDFGYYGGGGVGVQAGPGQIMATFRYYHGMGKVNDLWNSFNRSNSFSLGYRLAL